MPALLERVLNATVGRVLAWAGRQFHGGASGDDRRRELYTALSDAMSEAIAESEKVGVGYMTEQNHIEKGLRAELRLGELCAQLNDEGLLAEVAAFRSAAQIIFVGGARGDAQASKRAMREAYERALPQIRTLRPKD